MRKNNLYLILAITILVVIFTTAAICNLCQFQPVKKENNESTKESPDTTAAKYSTAFDIDYNNPDKYLVQGEQSKIPDTEAIEKLYNEEKGLDHLRQIYNWLNSEFSTFTASGGHIGVVTVEQLLNERSLGGCHDYALIYSAISRHFGYPAIMVETATIPWIKQFQENLQDADLHKGHVFVEAYLGNKWILIDPTSGWYVLDGYKPAQPVIPLDKNNAEKQREIYGYYAYLKGLDSWDMNIYSNSDTQKAMDEIATRVDLDEIYYPDYEFGQFKSN